MFFGRHLIDCYSAIIGLDWVLYRKGAEIEPVLSLGDEEG